MFAKLYPVFKIEHIKRRIEENLGSEEQDFKNLAACIPTKYSTKKTQNFNANESERRIQLFDEKEEKLIMERVQNYAGGIAILHNGTNNVAVMGHEKRGGNAAGINLTDVIVFILKVCNKKTLNLNLSSVFVSSQPKTFLTGTVTPPPKKRAFFFGGGGDGF